MKFYKNIKILILCTLFIATLVLPAFSQKMNAEDILVNHLASIGTAEMRAKNTSRTIVGDAKINYVTPKDIAGTGKIVIASQGEKLFWGTNINIVNYPQERFSFDGKDVKVSYIKNVKVSFLGDFVQVNEFIVDESLLGGSLSTSWALLDMAKNKARISYDGTKKFDGKETYVLKYSPNKGDLGIKMYFDKETFRHVRTEYKRDFPVLMGRVSTQSVSQRKSYLKVVETFDNFKEEEGLTLPHKYTFTYSFIGQNDTTEIGWVFDLNTFFFNDKLDDKTFDVEAN